MQAAEESQDTAQTIEDLLKEEGYETISSRDPKFYEKKSEARARIAHGKLYE